MAHVVLFPQLAFQKVDPDNPQMPVGDEVIVPKGERVPEWVDDFTLSSLSQAGMIVVVADDEEPEVPVEVGPPAPDVAREPDVDQGPAAPKPTDSRGAWEEYAVALGMPEGEAKAYANKGDLIEAANALAESKNK